MAVTDIEIDATAAQIEAAAKAEKWDRKKIFDLVHPQGSILFLPIEVTSEYLNNYFGITGTVWETIATLQGPQGTPIYGHRRLR